MTKIDHLKEINKINSSEQLFGLPEPLEFQCSKIDKIKKVVRKCEDLSYKSDRLEEQELRDKLNEINYSLWDLDSEIESIREACEGIREWGKAWKQLAKKIIESEEIDIEKYL